MSKHRCCCKHDRTTAMHEHCGKHGDAAHEMHETHADDAGTNSVIIEAESPESWDAAASAAVRKASETIRGITSIEVDTMSAQVQEGQIASYHIRSRVSFHLA